MRHQTGNHTSGQDSAEDRGGGAFKHPGNVSKWLKHGHRIEMDHWHSIAACGCLDQRVQRMVFLEKPRAKQVTPSWTPLLGGLLGAAGLLVVPSAAAHPW